MSRHLGVLRPWGWHPELRADRLDASGVRAWDERWRAAFDKRSAAALGRELNESLSHTCRVEPAAEAPMVATELSHIYQHIAYFCDRGHAEVLLKAPFGTAGRGSRRWRGGEARPWAERVLAQQGGVLVEPWRERLVDLSVHVDLGERPVFQGVTAFFTTAAGRWRASLVGPWDMALTPALRRFGHGEGREPGWLEGALRQAATRAQGPPGPAGVDAFLYRGPAGPMLRPLVEVNPRFTMGRVALALRRHLAPRRVGLWAVMSAADARAAGFASLEAWLLTRPKPRFAGGLREGVLTLTEPRAGLRFAGVLAVGRSLEEAWAALG